MLDVYHPQNFVERSLPSTRAGLADLISRFAGLQTTRNVAAWQTQPCCDALMYGRKKCRCAL